MKKPFAIKVCGMREEHNIRSVAAQEPSFMGFIFYKESPRYVGADFHIPADVSLSIKRVGVVVNETIPNIQHLVAQHHLHYVQLHGDENTEVVKNLYESGIALIKAFRIDDAFDFSSVRPYESYVEYFLFDTKGEKYGGNAKRFDWKKLDSYTGDVPFLLSGGIGTEHLDDVRKLQHSRLAGIDVNSRVELAPGVKDIEQVKQVMEYYNNPNHAI